MYCHDPAHARKSAKPSPGFAPSRHYNFGSHLHREFSAAAFSPRFRVVDCHIGCDFQPRDLSLWYCERKATFMTTETMLLLVFLLGVIIGMLLNRPRSRD
jgi:hypothetical protein